MKARDYRSVAARIRQELPELDRVAQRASRAWASASIADRVDGSLPSGPNRHQDLLRQIAAEMPGIRPAALTPDLVPTLDRYRGFRHVVRNVYAYVLDPRLIAVLVEDLPETNERLHTELAVFAHALETIAEAADD